jgi:hypothetical protein
MFSVPNLLMFLFVLVGDKPLKWNELVTRVTFVQFDEHVNSIKWMLTPSVSDLEVV